MLRRPATELQDVLPLTVSNEPYQYKEYPNVTIYLANGEILNYHRSVLVKKCEFFSRMLGPGITNHINQIIHLTDPSPNAVKTLLHCLYEDDYQPFEPPDIPGRLNLHAKVYAASKRLVAPVARASTWQAILPSLEPSQPPRRQVEPPLGVEALPVAAEKSQQKLIELLDRNWHQALPALPNALQKIYNYVHPPDLFDLEKKLMQVMLYRHHEIMEGEMYGAMMYSAHAFMTKFAQEISRLQIRDSASYHANNQDYTRILRTKDEIIKDQNAQLEEKNLQLSEKNDQLDMKDALLKMKDNLLREKDGQLNASKLQTEALQERLMRIPPEKRTRKPHSWALSEVE
ncbi:hypothetical protein GTA08_BOTSDO12396 [Botryosphaeria dothidea]|uniref:BTB domain-containing protein n=1 Tax=Botryosphaeria dothidea TaxID=55169 RepID=A0A8H4J3X1_9PEZI|nr:hypothetical protein GTA08_BOTSDO02692 [Botryosphaeria dothidea]KAF4312254.1 hypothetical protein GTA08_BOTSDO12396 [Botryosphaeria dothidea]